MENNKEQIDEKNNEITTSTQENVQKRSQSTGRLNIEEIYRRKAEERKRKKNAYIVVGIVVIVFIVVALYFLS